MPTLKLQGNFKTAMGARAAARANMNRRTLNFEHRTGLVLALFLALIVVVPAEAALSSNRYLFIVETSRGMQKREEGVKQAVTNLLGSGMRGQLQTGDTLGLWTYNNQLHAGKFPLQEWKPEKRDELTSRMLMFLGAEKYEKSPAIQKVAPALQPIVQNSDFITIVIISTGEEKITGTPFDDQINGEYKLWHDQQQKAKMPFITVLRANHGTITDSLVTPVPFPLELPPLPKAFVAEKAAPPKPAPTPPVVQPLIISGHKAEASPPPSSVGLGMVLEPEGVKSAPAERLVPDVPTPAPAQEALGAAGAIAKQSPALSNITAKSTVSAVPPTAAVQRSPAPPANARLATALLPSPGQKVFARELNPSVEPAAEAIPAAITVPAASAFGMQIIWAGGVFAAGLAVGLVFVFARKTRSPELSLITRSLERGKK